MLYRAQPISRGELRAYANNIRERLRLNNVLWLPVAHLLEAFHLIIGDDDFWWEPVEDVWLSPDKPAEYNVTENCIRIRNSTYVNACNGNGQDRMTIAHELSHVFIIKVSGVRFARNFDERPIRPYEDPEWQAKCLAGELMVPHHLIGGMNAQQIAQECGVSDAAARYQLDKYK